MRQSLNLRLFVMLMVIFLAGCHHRQLTTTPAPTSTMSASNEKSNANNQQASKVDKEMKLSRYGNPLHYQVAGEQYQVSRTSKDFKEQGIASWYGHPFHKERTSSGEVYDMYQMTAAHKTLPLPSMVKVKNLENGREIVVKVNDRGPFHDGRVIDLSYAAAKKLGMISKGVAKVMLQAIPTRITESQWYLQAGSFADVKRASRYKDFLKTFVHEPVKLIKKAKSNIVQIGPFKNRLQTQMVKTTLNNKGFHDIFSLMQ